MYQNKPGTAIPDFTKLSIFYKNFLTGVWDPEPGARAPGGRGGYGGRGDPSRLQTAQSAGIKQKNLHSAPTPGAEPAALLDLIPCRPSGLLLAGSP